MVSGVQRSGIDCDRLLRECGDQLHVRDHEGRSWTVALKPGDNAEMLARKLLREKFGKHHAFNQPIHYPPRSYH
jgi:hypothetical protein